jgi:hypothetical protein
LQFFQRGSDGYSDGRRAGTYDGVRLAIPGWCAAPFDVREVHSSSFADPSRFPTGSVEFDHALIMRRLESAWEARPPLSQRSHVADHA